MSPPFVIVIPARYGSSRLPAKALADVGGRPLVVRVLERARESAAREVWVATDDARIVEAVEAAGGRAMLTSAEHPSGTDRLAEVAATRGWSDDTLVVNLQGDEPSIPIDIPARLAGALADHPRAGIATMATPIHDAEELFRPSAVKVVLDDAGFALYFSRAPIPWHRDAFGDAPKTAGSLPSKGRWLRHLGLYAYRVETLKRLHAAPPAEIEAIESLEQLRALALGIPIHVGLLEPPPPPGVDTAEDLERVRRHFATSQARTEH